MVRRRGVPVRRTTAALVVLLFVSCLFALCAASTNAGQHARAHPVTHAVKDAGKVLAGSGVRGGADDGGWPAAGTVGAIVLAALVLAALRYGRRDAADQQCSTTAASSRGPPGRPVLA